MWEVDALSYQPHALEVTDLGLYLSFRSYGSVYFHGLVGSSLDGFAEGLSQSFSDTRNLDIQYRGALGITLGNKGAFNLQLEFLGTRIENQLGSISIGARYNF